MAELEVSPSVLSDGGGVTALGRAQVEVRGTLESLDPETIRVAEISRVTEGDTPCS